MKKKHSSSSLLPSNPNNFKVVVRVRPPIERELQKNNIYGSQGFKNIVRVDAETIIIGENLSYESSTVSGDEEVPESIAHSYRFKFDHVYDMDSRQTEVYETTAKEAVYNTLKVGV